MMLKKLYYRNKLNISKKVYDKYRREGCLVLFFVAFFYIKGIGLWICNKQGRKEKMVKMMQATVAVSAGDINVFKKIEVEKPTPKAGQLLIKSVATSLNPIDTKIRMGLAFQPDSYPAILHTDFSGVVEGIGDNVVGFEIGDSVYGVCGYWGGGSGALAQFQTVDARDIVKGSAPNLAGCGPEVGVRLEVPNFLKASMKALQSLSYDLKQKHHSARRNILFEDDSLDLVLDFCLGEGQKWRRVTAEQARGRAKKAPVAGFRVAEDELNDILASV